MAKNWESRSYKNFGPNYRLDVTNPEVGGDGPLVYKWRAVNQQNDIQLTSYSESGILRIYNDKRIEIVAGPSNSEKDIDIVIESKKGDITITCDGNGNVRIKGTNVMIEADQDIDMVAKRNINLETKSGTLKLNGNKVEVDGLCGNLVEKTVGSFTQKIFEKSKVGSDYLSDQGAVDANINIT